MNERQSFVAACAATLALYFLPLGNSLTYPFLIFATFIHETSHALATVLTFGQVTSLTVALDGSGLTYSQGGIGLIVSSAGYLGTALFGGLLLILSSKTQYTRIVLMACAVLVAAITAFFVGHASNLLVLAGLLAVAGLVALSLKKGWRPLVPAGVLLAGFIFYLISTGSLFSWLAGLLIPTVLLLIARLSSQRVAHFFLTFLAVQCLLNSVESLKTLFVISVNSGIHSDAQNMAKMTGLPAVIWSIVWILIAAVILFASVRIYFLPQRPDEPAKAT